MLTRSGRNDILIRRKEISRRRDRVPLPHRAAGCVLASDVGTNSELLAAMANQASEQRPRISPEKPIITASAAEALRNCLKRFAVTLNQAKCIQKSCWFRAVRLLVKGPPAETLDNFITSEFGGEGKYAEALSSPADPLWDVRWTRFVARLKQVGALTTPLCS